MARNARDLAAANRGLTIAHHTYRSHFGLTMPVWFTSYPLTNLLAFGETLAVLGKR